MDLSHCFIDLDISFTFYQNILFSDIATSSLTHGGWGLLNQSSMNFWIFDAISNEFFFWFGPSPKILEEKLLSLLGGSAFIHIMKEELDSQK